MLGKVAHSAREMWTGGSLELVGRAKVRSQASYFMLFRGARILSSSPAFI